jgi:hypothetical protein
MPDSRNGAAGHTAYFERPPEKLVLDGYRHLIRGAALSSSEHLTKAQLLYRRLLGDDDGEKAIMALAKFVRTLGQCAACPLNVFKPGSRHICRDESLVMALIAGIQNGDEQTIHYCLEKLCRPDRRDPAAMTAGAFALTLKSMDCTMLPIPAHVVERIMSRPQAKALDALVSGTIH